MEIYSPNNDEEGDRLNLDSMNEKNVEFQRYLMDLEYLDVNFFESLCGWIPVNDTKTDKILGEDHNFSVKKHEINKASRVINETGALLLAKGLDGLIGRVTQTSNLDPRFIWRQWNGYITEVINIILVNYYDSGNTFEIDIDNFGYIIAKVCSYYGVTFKATGGFFAKQSMNTVVSMYNMRSVQDFNNAKNGKSLLERIGFGGINGR